MTQTEYLNLVQEITKLDHYYHTLDRPLKSDFEYDQLWNQLLATEAKHPEWIVDYSPTRRVGGTILNSFKKVAHRTSMLSLTNSYSKEDILTFTIKTLKSLQKSVPIDYFVEPKYDGLAMELVYEYGVLSLASTRGDGITGEDVTDNIRTIRTIPLFVETLKTTPVFEVRGEVLFYKTDFLMLNSEQEEAGLPPFANARNAAAGTIRQLDSKIAAKRPLRFFAYGLGITQGVQFETQYEIYLELKRMSFPVAPTSLCKVVSDEKELSEFYDFVHKQRIQLDFEIDGIVVKVNSIELQNELGVLARSPKWATAVKYPPERAETEIKNILVQVGRTGALTPVAIMKPVEVGGVTVTQATLHNQDEIQRKDIRVGDRVWVQRAGDVIPEISEVILSKRPANSNPFEFPTHCPVCNTKVERPEGEAISRCPNIHCPAILKESFKHFASRKALNIEKVGDKLIDELVDRGFLVQLSDFFRLNKESLLQLNRKGEKSISNILTSIEKCRRTELSRFIFALGLRFVGEQTAKTLSDQFHSVSELSEAPEELLQTLPDIGPRVASSIVNAFNNPSFRSDVLEIEREFLIYDTNPIAKTGVWSGKTFVVTGTLPVNRNDAYQLVKSNGGKIVTSVSPKLDFILVGDNPGSKFEKAQKLGIAVLHWNDLQSIINQ